MRKNRKPSVAVAVPTVTISDSLATALSAAETITTTIVVDDADQIVKIEQGIPAGAPVPALTSIPRSDVSVKHADLKGALARLVSVVDKKSTMPMLANVLIRSHGSDVELVGTDLGVSLTISIATGKGSGAIAATMGAHKLHALVRTLPRDDVSLTGKGSHVMVASGVVAARIDAMADRDYPKIPTPGELPWCTVDAKAWRSAIESVEFSLCRDETRFHLAGALMQCDGTTLTMVSTDGHRLTKVREPWAWSGKPMTDGVIIPRKGLAELRKLLATRAPTDECQVVVKFPHLFVRRGNATLTIKLTDAHFPPYEQVIPKDNRTLVTVERKRLIEALQRAKIVASDTRGVKLELSPGALTLATDDPDAGDVREPIPAESCDASGRWGVAPGYLLELLGELPEGKVTLAFAGELDPIMVRSTDDAAMRPIGGARLLGVIMPMRV
jgi:DNA polymerase-3 subunit beta